MNYSLKILNLRKFPIFPYQILSLNSAAKWIVKNTLVSNESLTPQIKLRLITIASPLWMSTPEACPLPDPYWAFYWPGGQGLTRYILDNPEVFKDSRILDFGAGCGSASIAATQVGAGRILANDIDKYALLSTKLNFKLNQISDSKIEYSSENFLENQKNLLEFFKNSENNYILLGDMFYDSDFAEIVFSSLKKVQGSSRNLRILVGDPDRHPLAENDYLKRYKTKFSKTKLFEYQLPGYVIKEHYVLLELATLQKRDKSLTNKLISSVSMSNPRNFCIYFSEHDENEPKILTFFEHIWRFFDVFLLEIRSELEIDYTPKIKYCFENSEIEKIRGGEDFEHFVDKIRQIKDENEEIVIILENPEKNDENSKGENLEESPIFPSSLQRGKYVGDGVHGTVRMGFHEKSQKWYVIKTILSTSQNSSHEAIQKEILAYKECSKCEFVVDYFGCEVGEKKKELVLEYMDKGDLRAFGVLPVEIHQQVGLALIRGLKHIWKSGPGYIHRDIKPENILCNSSGFIKISDFGAAKRIDNTYKIASSAAGTLFYQAPEQQLGMDYSEKVDVWCFGLTLWELAIGPNLEDYYNSISDGSDDVHVPIIDGFPTSLVTLIRNCLRRSPAQRWNEQQIESCDYLKNVQIDRDLMQSFLNKF
ncbi:unnamed protein product [Caenorhabditis angaria]|uniref:ETFB lysine methyltransferase n=1 Tax=Caenorhabditis angaria TaxID=860376 RepID=A0A9P1MVZ2_9PELO|nr:unnamed protein product [Caenorhabditis angaria]